jgi:hypothetical protein
MNIIDLLSDDDEDDEDDALLMGAAHPIFASYTPRVAFVPESIAAPMTVAAVAAVAVTVPEQDSKPHVTAPEQDSKPRVTAPEQDSKPHVTILGSCHLTIVGTQFYTGKSTVSIGESVKLEREPTNVSSSCGFRQRLPVSMPFSHLFSLLFCRW